MQDPAEEPGNFCNPVGRGSYDDNMRNKEFNNGRFAMFAALGIIAAECSNGCSGALSGDGATCESDAGQEHNIWTSLAGL